MINSKKVARIYSDKRASDLEGIVAKHRNGAYLPDAPEWQWVKVLNPEYSQLAGREDLFTPGEKKQPQPDWSACTLACAEAEL